MPRYTYVALDARGQESTGLVDANFDQRSHRPVAPGRLFSDQRLRRRQSTGREAKAVKQKKTKAARVAAPAAKEGSIVLFQRKTVKPNTS